VLDAVDAIPPGAALTYGDLAELAGGGGSARAVGMVLTRHGAEVPWWRVVHADGRPPAQYAGTALRRLAREGCPMLGSRVDLARARLRAFRD
jgi:alkylated DNA nucleotide flippase Atl1